MSVQDPATLCATVGCNHRRDHHVRLWGRFGCDSCNCTNFTEPPTVAEAYKCQRHPACAWANGHSAACLLWNKRRSEGRELVEDRSVWPVPPLTPSVAEHDDNLDLEAIRARADRLRAGLARPIIAQAGQAEIVLDDLDALLAALDAERAIRAEALALHQGPQLSDFNAGEFCSCGDRWPCEHRRILGGKD